MMAEVNPTLQTWLAGFLASAGAAAGTVHLHVDGGLRLAAAVNIPPQVQQVVAWVPNGKGMAGLALQRGEAVQTCNLQEDRSGAVKPGARAVNAQAAVAMPVRKEGGAIVAIVGAAWMEERTIEGEELARLEATARSLVEVIDAA